MTTVREMPDEEPDFWRCKTCGCLWRDNRAFDDESVSLSSAKQTSCSECESNPTADVCEPLFRRPSASALDPKVVQAALDIVQDDMPREALEGCATTVANYVLGLRADLPQAPDLIEAAKDAVREWRLHGQLTDSCRHLEAAIVRAARAGAEAPPLNLLVEVIVNGKPVSVTAGPIRDVIQQAIARAGMFGAPIDQWELRTRDGDVIPHALPGGVEFALMGGQRLFLNLGLPPALRGAEAPPPEGTT